MAKTTALAVDAVAQVAPSSTPGQHSVAKSIVLHLFPGLALATFVLRKEWT